MPLSHGVPETSLTGHHPSFPNGWLDAHVVQPFHVCPSLTPPNKHFWQGRSSCIDEEDKNRESSRALPDLHTIFNIHKIHFYRIGSSSRAGRPEIGGKYV